MYTAILLTENSRQLILSTYKAKLDSLPSSFRMETPQGDDLLHHATLQMGDFDSSLNDTTLKGETIKLKIVSFAYDEKVAAFGLEHKSHPKGASFGVPEVITKNKMPHITAMIDAGKGGKPFLSNKLENWESVQEIEVEGVIKVL